jgi:TonB family protein
VKNDVPFYVAFVTALVLHLAAGAGLKYSRLLASPAPPAPRPPLTVRFVEVPPNAKSAPQAPDTNTASDANRKAGPLAPSPRRPVTPQPLLRPPGRPSQTPQPQHPQQAVEQSPRQAQLPPAGNGAADAASGQRLARSLENLDRYIQGGGSNNSSGGEGGRGDVPTGDPGSGVFFDTQGFDLGPWGNRAVEIVRSNWIIPVAADLGMKGVVGVAFKVDRSGKLLDVHVISPSGVPSFDQAAVSALQSSSPLPPLPPDFPRQVLPGVFRFYYNLPVPR